MHSLERCQANVQLALEGLHSPQHVLVKLSSFRGGKCCDILVRGVRESEIRQLHGWGEVLVMFEIPRVAFAARRLQLTPFFCSAGGSANSPRDNNIS